jgi:DNA replication protein DnaC
MSTIVLKFNHRTLYYYAPKLFRTLQIGQVDGSLPNLLKKLARATSVIIDDFGIAAVAGKQYWDLLGILDDRQGMGATLLTSQFPVNQWHEIIADATVADGERGSTQRWTRPSRPCRRPSAKRRCAL